jgi:signal transduction histidine kinase
LSEVLPSGKLRSLRHTSLSRDARPGHSAVRHAATGVAAGALAIAAVTLVIGALQHVMDPAALTGLYLFAILPVAIGRGFWSAGVAAVASYLTFEFFFLAPVHSFAIADGAAAAALVIAVVTAYVVSELARRAHVRAREAEEAQASQRRLADEQAALRRVATLVAQGLPTREIFETVTREIGLLCDADVARMERFETDGDVTAIAAWSRDARAQLAVGARFALEGLSIAAQVRETGRPARVDLVASRERLLTAGDEARRRVVRDLHDGAQQRFVHTILALELALPAFDSDAQNARTLVAEALQSAEAANRELRELAHGLLPDVLIRGGLAAGVESIVLGLRVPVDVAVPEDRFASEIESSAYFVVAEALTNVAKHSGAQHANVAARVENETLRIDVCDDGVGGARPDGSGLLGVRDRVAALGGDLEVDSPPGGGTRLAVTLPLRR